jgi:predicted aspartyl protease
MAQHNQVISTIYPFLQIRVEVRGWRQETLALIDTGFDGALAVPSSVLNLLGDPDASTDWELADGSTSEAPSYYGGVEIVGFSFIPDLTIVVLDDEYLLGREILDMFEVTFDHGRRVIVRL